MKQNSLQSDLGKWLLIIVVVFGVIGTLISFTLAYAHAKDLQDDFLEQIGTWLRAGNTIDTRSLLYDFDDEQIIIQPLGSDRPLLLPTQLKPGFHNIEGRDEPWRIFVVVNRGQYYAIAQQTELREELAFSSALTSALPMLLLSGALYLGLRIGTRTRSRTHVDIL